jgi:ubiquinone/menaquinone biosynthesis C-methylase UbiE
MPRAAGRMLGVETGVTWLPGAHRLLELGCGREPTPGTLIGIDKDADAVRAAAAAGASCVVADAQRLPIADHAVDGVLARGLLHHIRDMGALLLEIRRVLEPAGSLVVVDALPMPTDQYTEMSRQLHRRGLPSEPRNGIDPAELTVLATASGFREPTWEISGEWTHATPPFVDHIFASPAVTYSVRAA